ncbi:MAG TPA: isoprenylcysteine carboxylmethyltransferase family protein [Bacteroidota bacterium]
MAGIREQLFRFRSYTPIPFLIAMMVFAQPTVWSFIAGAVIAASGEGMRFWGVAYAGPLTRVTGGVGAPALIVAGPFALVRNPLYVGNILLYFGVGIMANALTPWLALGTVAYFVTQYAAIVWLEEEFLQKHFGARFDEYRKAVPRFVPRLSPWPEGKASGQEPDWKGAVRSERRTLQAISLVGLMILVRWWI